LTREDIASSNNLVYCPRNMTQKYEKSEIASADREMDRSSLEHGAVEQLHIPSYQFSPEAEKRLVRKIDLTFVAFVPDMWFLY
jgi:hypothetical protein